MLGNDGSCVPAQSRHGEMEGVLALALCSGNLQRFSSLSAHLLLFSERAPGLPSATSWAPLLSELFHKLHTKFEVFSWLFGFGKYHKKHNHHVVLCSAPKSLDIRFMMVKSQGTMQYCDRNYYFVSFPHKKTFSVQHTARLVTSPENILSNGQRNTPEYGE